MNYWLTFIIIFILPNILFAFSTLKISCRYDIYKVKQDTTRISTSNKFGSKLKKISDESSYTSIENKKRSDQPTSAKSTLKKFEENQLKIQREKQANEINKIHYKKTKKMTKKSRRLKSSASYIIRRKTNPTFHV